MLFYRIFVLFFFCVFTLQADSRFYVSDVFVDIKDTSAAVARTKAILEGQRKAFKKLMTLLLTSEDQISLSQPTDDQLSVLIQNFQIQNEKNSRVRYVATFSFQFNPQKVEAYLNKKQKEMISTPSNNKILVLPVYQKEDRFYIWQEENLWHQTWENMPDPETSYFLPLGDLTDRTELSVQKVLRKDLINLQKLRERYQAGYALLAVLKEETPFKMDLYLYNAEGLTYSETSVPVLGDTLLTTSLVQKARKKMLSLIDDYLKNNLKALPSEKKHLEGHILFNTHAEWLKIQKLLAENLLLRELNLKSLQKMQAALILQYTGSEKKFLQSLEKQGFNIKGNVQKHSDRSLTLYLNTALEEEKSKYRSRQLIYSLEDDFNSDTHFLDALETQS